MTNVTVGRETGRAAEDPASDLVLIQETLKGDPEAFGRLMQKYRPKFLGMATAILKSREEADDVLQDSFIQAYRHLADFQNKSRFSTWLYSIVLNHIRNRLRHGKVLRWAPFEDTSDPEERRPINIPEKNPALDVVLDHKLQVEAVHQEIGRLPAPYQPICIMHYFNGMLLKDVALELDRPLGTVKVYLHRARKILHRRLGAGMNLPMTVDKPEPALREKRKRKRPAEVVPAPQPTHTAIEAMQ